jgi:hypothetical protein
MDRLYLASGYHPNIHEPLAKVFYKYDLFHPSKAFFKFLVGLYHNIAN